MPRITPAIFILLMLAPLMCNADSLGEKIMSELSIQKLREKQQESQARIANLANVTNLNPRLCLATSRTVCVDGVDKRVEFLPPFPAAIEPNLTAAKHLSGSRYFSWAPETVVDQGRSILAPILQSAELYQPLACDDEQCEVAVNTLKGPNRQALAICTVFKLDKQLGPPNQCEAVAVREGPEWWIKVIDFAGPLPSPRIVRVYKLEVRGLPRSSILMSLDKALSNQPLVMPDRSVKSDHVMAMAPKRFSRVLSGGWFEWVQVLIELGRELEVEISLNLLVNKQNTDNPADWHLPTDQQQAEYSKVIVKTVTEALIPIFVQPIWEGSKVLRCTKLRTKDGATVKISEGASSEQYSKKQLNHRIIRK